MREYRTVRKLVDVIQFRSDDVPSERAVTSDRKGDMTTINDVSTAIELVQRNREQHTEHMLKYRATQKKKKGKSRITLNI